MIMVGLYDKIYGCIAGSRIASAMAVPTEGWQYEDIEAHWGGPLQDFPSQEDSDVAVKKRWATFTDTERLPKRQPLPTLWRPDRSKPRPPRVVGMTEDGIERQKLLTTAIIEKQGRISTEDWARVIERDVNPDKHFNNLFWIGDEYVYPMIKGGVPPTYAGIFFPWPDVHGFTRGCHPIGIINAGNPTEAARDAVDVGMLMYPRYGSGLWSAGCYAAAIAEALKRDATVDSVIAAAKANGEHSMAEWIDRVMEVARQHTDVFALRNELTEWFRGWSMCGEENVTVALAIFCVTDGDLKKSIIAGVNWGRDTDCIAAMAAGLSGALSGKGSISQRWIDLVDNVTKDCEGTVSTRSIEDASRGLMGAVQANVGAMRNQIAALEM
jgi:ADP-ribosylglycohydrolase